MRAACLVCLAVQSTCDGPYDCCQLQFQGDPPRPGPGNAPLKAALLSLPIFQTYSGRWVSLQNAVQVKSAAPSPQIRPGLEWASSFGRAIPGTSCGDFFWMNLYYSTGISL